MLLQGNYSDKKFFLTQIIIIIFLWRNNNNNNKLKNKNKNKATQQKQIFRTQPNKKQPHFAPLTSFLKSTSEIKKRTWVELTWKRGIGMLLIIRTISTVLHRIRRSKHIKNRTWRYRSERVDVASCCRVQNRGTAGWCEDIISFQLCQSLCKISLHKGQQQQ